LGKNVANLKKVTLALATAGLLSSGVAQAALNDRGGGLLYDDVLNVTWLQDANYAKTSGVNADGRLNWGAANTWAANLSFHDSVRNVDYTDWRLAANTPVGANWNYNFLTNGSTDYGYNITSPASELSYMYYVNLGLKAPMSTSGANQEADLGVHGNGTYGGQADVGLVRNLQGDAYWSGTVYAPNPALYAWYFATSNGHQGYNYQTSPLYAWAVRPGDVAAAIPEPETYAMLLAGLGLLGVMAKRRRRSFGAS
jgi:PEP-CTERM motif-containing protein